MDAELRLRVKTLDAALIGRRIRDARLRAGLTQGQLAGVDASTAYVSRIEAGTRRPSLELVHTLAERLDTTPELLLAPDDESPDYVALVAGVQLRVDYAELALHTGDLTGALDGAAQVIADVDAPLNLRRTARYVRALALEAGGDLGEAISELERLAEDQGDGPLWLRSLLALSRCHRVAGDLARAADIGDWAAPRIEELGLAGTDEAVQLTVTVAGAHFARGDVNHAVQMCLAALDTAVELGSPLARASAYWNSSIFESSRGNVASALSLAQRAVTLLQHSEDARNLARLRTEIGLMQLRLDPPQAEDAVANLERSRSELTWTSASRLDVARNLLGRAEASLILGDGDAAERLVEECLELAGESAHLIRGSAELLRSRLALGAGRPADAANAVARARAAAESAESAESGGHGRSAAQLWFDIAAAAEEQGDLAGAVSAYRRAGGSTGLRSRRVGLTRS